MTQRETFEEWWETKGRFAGPESGVSWFDARKEMMGHAYAAALASDTRRSFPGVMQTAFLGCAPVIDGEPFPHGSYVLIKCADDVEVAAGGVTVIYDEATNPEPT